MSVFWGLVMNFVRILSPTLIEVNHEQSLHRSFGCQNVTSQAANQLESTHSFPTKSVSYKWRWHGLQYLPVSSFILSLSTSWKESKFCWGIFEDTLPETSVDPENGWLKDDPLLFGARPIFRCYVCFRISLLGGHWKQRGGSTYHVHFVWQVWHGHLSAGSKFNKLKSFSREIWPECWQKNWGKGFAVRRLNKHNFCSQGFLAARIRWRENQTSS